MNGDWWCPLIDKVKNVMEIWSSGLDGLMWAYVLPLSHFKRHKWGIRNLSQLPCLVYRYIQHAIIILCIRNVIKLTNAWFDSELGCGTTKLILFLESCTLTTTAKYSLGSLKNSATIVVTFTFNHLPIFRSFLDIFTELSVYGTDALLPWLFRVTLLTCRFIVKWSSPSKLVLWRGSSSWTWMLRTASWTSFWRTLLVNLKLMMLKPLKWLWRRVSMNGKTC